MRLPYPRIGIDRAQRTYCTYGKQNKYFQQFIRAKYNLRDIPLTQLDLPFIEKFDFYLRIERGMKPNTVLTTIVRLMSAAKVALHRNLIPHHPFLGYKFIKPEFQIRSLPPEEFERIISTPIQSASLNFIRDLFVFACFTGVSYIDLKNLTQKEVITEDDGSLWISKSRQKTDTPFNVKLLDIPIQIIEKYKGLASDNYVFPVLALASINIEREHLHIISLRINEAGKKINDSYEVARSMKICKELEQEFGLVPLQETERPFELPKKIIYTEGDLKQKAKNIAESVMLTFHFQSFGEYRAVLEFFNLTAEEVKIKDKQNGILYSVLDDKGNKVRRPFKSSLFGKETGYKALQKHFENSKLAIEKKKNKRSPAPDNRRSDAEGAQQGRF